MPRGVPRYYDDPKNRILRNVDVDEHTGCWNWKRSLNTGGYGNTGARRGEMAAHRLSYVLFVGNIPEGAWVLHRCDNRRCCNPDHLFLGSRQDNMDDMVAKGRSSRGESRRGHKLTGSDVVDIRSRYADGSANQQRLADEYGVTNQTISSIVRGKKWKHVQNGAEHE